VAEHYLLRIATCEGNYSLTKGILMQLRGHLDNPDFYNRQLYYDLITGAFYSEIGLPDMVPHWLVMEEDAGIEIHVPVRELIVSVKHYIAFKKYDRALTVLCKSYPRAPQNRLLFGELALSLLTAVARIHLDDTAGAMLDFEKAYELSLDGELEMFFIELGKKLHPLVAAALKQQNLNIPEKWLKTIDRKAYIYAKKAAVITNSFKTEKKIEDTVSLSDREREILSDMYHGLTREEIATNRYLSINTVNKIVPSIFIKLDAKNSADAIRIAIEKKLIE